MAQGRSGKSWLRYANDGAKKQGEKEKGGGGEMGGGGAGRLIPLLMKEENIWQIV